MSSVLGSGLGRGIFSHSVWVEFGPGGFCSEFARVFGSQAVGKGIDSAVYSVRSQQLCCNTSFAK